MAKRLHSVSAYTQPSLTPATFAALPPGLQRQTMEDHLYKLAYRIYPDLAVIFTRVLLEYDYN